MNFKQLKDFDFKNIDLKNIEIDRNQLFFAHCPCF